MVGGAGEGGAGESGAGDGRQGPGKGTQVVLLRHGMSTFNKLNIFTVRKCVLWRVCIHPTSNSLSHTAVLLCSVFFMSGKQEPR